MTIDALPTPPSNNDSPAAFAAKASAFVAALPTLVAQINAEVTVTIPAIVSTVAGAAAAAAEEIAEAIAAVDEETAVTYVMEANEAKLGAQAAQAGAEAALDAALIGANVYGSTALAMAASTAVLPVGAYFKVIGSGDVSAQEYQRTGAATFAAVGGGYPSALAVDDIYHERLAAAFAAHIAKSRFSTPTKPQAAIAVLLGQSNNARRNTSISGTVSVNAYMPAGGNSITGFQFYASNAEHTAHYSDVGSVITHAEGTTECPCSGVIAGLLGGPFDRVYACSVAIGSRSLLTLGGMGPRNNLYAVVHKLCDHARSAGFDPVVMFDTHHGEAEMAAGKSEASYYADGWAYYRMCQMVAAQAMERPEYDAPIAFHAPIVMSFGDVSRGIFSAIRRLANDLPNGIFLGSSYQFPSEADRTHQDATGFRLKGEMGGKRLRDFFQNRDRFIALKLVDAVRVGTTVRAIFNQEIVRDTTFDFGTNLNTTKALAGFEYIDAGTEIQITAVAIQGRTAVLTLASAPVGDAAQQVVRIAEQTTTGVLTAGSNNRPGSQIRINEPGFLAIHDYTFRNYAWAAPDRINVRT